MLDLLVLFVLLILLRRELSSNEGIVLHVVKVEVAVCVHESLSVGDEIWLVLLQIILDVALYPFLVFFVQKCLVVRNPIVFII